MRRLADEADLRDLVNRYFYGLDRRDAAVLASIYTPGGVERGDGKVVDVESHVAALLRVGRFAYSHHFIGSQSFLVDGDSATGDTYAIAFLVTGEAGLAESNRILVRGLQYIDRYIRTDGGWLIAGRDGPIPLWQFESDSLPPHLPEFVLAG